MSGILPRYRNNQVSQYSTTNYIQQNQPQILQQQSIENKNNPLAITNEQSNIQTIPIKVPNTQSLLMIGHEDEIYTVDFSKEGSYIASGDKSGQIYIWESETGSNLTTFKLFKNAINQIKFYDKDHNIIGCSSDHSIKLIDTENQKTVRNFKGHTSYINSLDHNNKGLIISVDNKGQIYEWDKKCKKPIANYKQNYSLLSVLYDTKSDIFYTGGIENKIYTYDKIKQDVFKVYNGHQDSITNLQVSFEGSYMLSNSMDNTLKLWDIRQGSKKLKPLKTYRGIFNSVDYNLLRGDINYDGSKIASGSSNGEVIVWHSNTKQILMKLQGHQGTVNQCIFHPKKDIVLSASTDRQIILTDISDIKKPNQ